MRILLYTLLLTLLATVTADSLVEWLRSKPNSFVNSNIQILPDSIIATTTIHPNELILGIPVAIGGNGEDTICETIREFLATDQNHPLVKDVLSKDKPKRLPSMWSQPGKELLESILEDDEGDFPPVYATRWVETIWLSQCDASFDENLTQQLQTVGAVLQQQRHGYILPLVDRIQHSTAKANVDKIIAHDRHEFRATRTILPGETLYQSLSWCRYYCDGTLTTPQLFRNYGIVEDYPQVWPIGDSYFAEITRAYRFDGTPIEDEYEFRWVSEKPSLQERRDLANDLRELQEAQANLLINAKDVPTHELHLIRDYLDAFTTALELALTAGDYPEKPRDDSLKEGPYTGELQEFVQWLIDDMDGIVNPKVEIRRVQDEEASGSYRYGVFAKEDIQENELIALIPEAAMMNPAYAEEDISPPVFGEVYTCIELELLVDEFSKGEESVWGPYIEYLMNEADDQIPHVWSNTSQDLLIEILDGGGRNKIEVLPPTESVSYIRDDWRGDCFGSDNPFEVKVVMIALHHQTDGILIPFYDIMRHSSGNEVNSDIDQFFGEEDTRIRATRAIRKGEEITKSYNFCNDCGNKRKTYGTAQMLRDRGIVENPPQLWSFPSAGVAFHLVPLYDNDGSESSNFTVVQVGEDPGEEGIAHLQKSLERLKDLIDLRNEGIKEAVPSHEYALVEKYESSLKSSIQTVLASVGQNGVEIGCTVNDSSCIISARKYDTFDFQFVNVFESELTMCNIDRSLLYARWDVAEEIQSLYQKLTFLDEKEYNVMCLELDNIFQVCSNFRPHYHELQVHYPARFLDEVKRVAWIGGGDSMLLHEMLKLPSLELALGLELDQNVTRYSFKHFGSQPHWENDKVEWWFGDAAKSLLMLPRDYFQSFDLVLIDLSETVMSFAVTEKLDITEALTLLMKPGGIFVKNEHYFRKMSKLFKNTLEVHVHDLPSVCAQAMILGSNEIDFMDELEHTRDHGVETLYLLPNEEMANIGHGFKRNYDHLKYNCDEFTNEVDIQKRSPGILMVLEAEGIIKNISMRREDVLASIQSAGFDIVASEFFDSGSTGMIVLQEGYVVLHGWPDSGYIALDIHIWAKFDRHENLKKALLLALRADNTASSSYRIVAGGMFGMNTWKNDELARGPGNLVECSTENEPVAKTGRTQAIRFESEANGDLRASAIGTSLNLLPGSSKLAIVLCSGERSKRCLMEEVVKGSKVSPTVLRLSSCAHIEGLNEFMDEYTAKMRDCENSIITWLHNNVGPEGKVDAIFIDTEVSFQMAQAFHKAVQPKRNRIAFFSDSLFLMCPILSAEEGWRRHFVDRFMHVFLLWEPVFMVEMLLQATDNSGLEMVVTSAGDELFFKRLLETKTMLESQFTVDITSIEGGKVRYMPDFDETTASWYYPHDYSQEDNARQYLSQSPVALQALLQLEIPEGSSFTISAESLQTSLMDLLNDMDIEVEGSQQYSGSGEGALMYFFFSDGRVVVLWDGRRHVDVNVLLEDEDFEFIQEVEGAITERFAGLQIALRDVFPRGHGRNVNFRKDLSEPRKLPKWATSKPETSPPTFGRTR